jgi:16S rRNA (guanine966-N2)-methyltransferase
VTRIVAGTVGGRILKVPQRGTRPTTELVREALFNALDAAGGLDGARVLDLYAGSGALGLEALSRGAAEAVFVESDRNASEILKGNIRALGFTAATQIRRATVRSVLDGGTDTPFDLVLADPPFALDAADFDAALAALPVGGWTEPGSTVIVERPNQAAEPVWHPPLFATRSKEYGQAALFWAEHE